MKVTILGSAGQIGAYLSEYLKKRGHDVTDIDIVNGVQYGLTSTPTTTTAGGVTQPVSTAKSLAMTSGTQLKPVVALQTLSAVARFLYCHFIKISRTLA